MSVELLSKCQPTSQGGSSSLWDFATCLGHGEDVDQILLMKVFPGGPHVAGCRKWSFEVIDDLAPDLRRECRFGFSHD